MLLWIQLLNINYYFIIITVAIVPVAAVVVVVKEFSFDNIPFNVLMTKLSSTCQERL